VVDNLPQFIFWKNFDSVFLGCNENFALVAGLSSPEEVVGKTDFDLAWKREEAEFFRAVDRRVMDSGKAEYRIVEPQMQSNGKQAWLETNKIPLFDSEGKVTGILGTFEDITQRKLEEDAAQHARRLESIGKLSGGIAHDFNNLLAGIMGAAELLQSTRDEDQRQELVEEILRSSARAADLTSKLLAFSRRGNVREEVVDLHQAIENVAPLLRRGLDPRVEVIFDLQAVVPFVLGDSSELELAILNLGLNARDAMPRGGRLHISTRNIQISSQESESSPFDIVPGEYLRVVVEDTGTGISEELIDRVFEPFFTTKSRSSGTGLGLAAVYGAVQAHRGAISVERQRSIGARFLIDLPTNKGKLSPVPGEQRDALMTRGGVALVVDDEPLVRRTAAERLQRLGFDVITAEDGEKALRLFEERCDEISVALIDVVMAGMGGVECARRMRERRPSLPIVLSSGFTQQKLIGNEEGLRTVVFLKKPYASKALALAVESAFAMLAADGASSSRP
jgi:PAS domain S-box-containing protein